MKKMIKQKPSELLIAIYKKKPIKKDSYIYYLLDRFYEEGLIEDYRYKEEIKLTKLGTNVAKSLGRLLMYD
jgi:hypothetical protein